MPFRPARCTPRSNSIAVKKGLVRTTRRIGVRTKPWHKAVCSSRSVSPVGRLG
jgi:hypothetical protein